MAAVVVAAALAGLGTWQLQRRAWKLDLIARVDARVHAAPVPAPAQANWPGVNAADYEYRHVGVTGEFQNGLETLVAASTELGPGFWVLTPLRQADGTTVLVNRGFVPPERRDPASRAAGQIEGQTTVTGLLRMSEPHGFFLRTNDPAADRWYSRDVAAIAAKRGLSGTAPYFIDAEASRGSPEAPVGGLTVVNFRNAHLVYALTWYGLAAMLLASTAAVTYQGWRARGSPEPLVPGGARNRP